MPLDCNALDLFNLHHLSLDLVQPPFASLSTASIPPPPPPPGWTWLPEIMLLAVKRKAVSSCHGFSSAHLLVVRRLPYAQLLTSITARIDAAA